MNYAIVWAAGPVDYYDDSERAFGVPKAILSLGWQTVIERLVRQLKRRDIVPIVGVGRPGEEGWTDEHMSKFHHLDCTRLISPHVSERYPLKTACFLLRMLQKQYSPKGSDKIYLIPGDFVFSEEKMGELTTYPAPCIYGFKGEDDKSFVLTGAALQEFLDKSEGCEAWYQVFPKLDWQYCVSGEKGHWAGKDDDGFVEIDFDYEWEDAKEMVKQEQPKVCYVGQKLYFGKQVGKDAMWLELAQGLDCNWNVLLEVDADLFVFFMPHHVPPRIKGRVGLDRMIGVHAEPLPKFIDGEYRFSEDLLNRLKQMTAAFDFKHLYHHDKTSFPVLEREGVHVKEFISAIDTDTYFPEEREKRWDLMFCGRETQHRLDVMMPAKHQFGRRFLHIAHGIDGRLLNDMQNMSTIAINCHTEGIPALENRLQTAMASRLFVLSEPLSHNDFFVPGVHFVEFRDANELVHKARYYLEHEGEREAIVQAGHELVTRELSAKVAWPRLFDEALNETDSQAG